MLRDILQTLPDVLGSLDDAGHQWVCLGVVQSAADVDDVEAALGDAYEVMSEPFEEDIAVAGGHPWIRGARSWEVWARTAKPTA